MKGKGKQRRKRKKQLWQDLLKKKWNDVNRIPRRQPQSQSKTIA
ncbi:hypothetical protein [Alteribacter aurantiacus]|nr:hypothetical protein [Alteribacter aurantiacus]